MAMSSRDHASGLHGRRGECDLLDRLVTAARAGESQVLVLRGEPGIGKTALLDYLARTRPRVSARAGGGAESEMELAFAGLHQLCAPMLDRLDHLPGPQRDALGTAFGLSAGDAPDRFLVGLAVLSLLSEVGRGAAAGVPDRRRAVARSGLGADAGVRRAPPAGRAGRDWCSRCASSATSGVGGAAGAAVGGLRDGDARALLDSAVARAAGRAGARTGSSPRPRGNPLALLELPRGLDARGAGGRLRAARRARRWRAGSSRASSAASSRCRPRRNGCCSRRQPSRSATCRCCWRAAERLGHRSRTRRRRPRRRG